MICLSIALVFIGYVLGNMWPVSSIMKYSGLFGEFFAMAQLSSSNEYHTDGLEYTLEKIGFDIHRAQEQKQKYINNDDIDCFIYATTNKNTDELKQEIVEYHQSVPEMARTYVLVACNTHNEAEKLNELRNREQCYGWQRVYYHVRMPSYNELVELLPNPDATWYQNGRNPWQKRNNQ